MPGLPLRDSGCFREQWVLVSTRPRAIGFYWGVAGVLGILLFAIIRLSLRVLEMSSYSLSVLQWAILLIFALYMAYAEGYKGFHLNFAPRVVARARYFLQPGQHSVLLVIFAPLFCMGFIHATARRRLISVLVTSAIIGLVIIVSMMPQPWRGLIDFGVVTGLGIGVLSILRFWHQAHNGEWTHPIEADLPEKS